MWRKLFPWLGKPKRTDPAARVFDLHLDQTRARPHFAGIEAMEDTPFMELDDVLGVADAENAIVDKDRNHPPLAEHVRQTCFLAAYAVDAAARLEADPDALESGLHRALRGQTGSALAKRYAKTAAAPGQPVDRDQMMKAAIKDIFRAEMIAQAIATEPTNYRPIYELIGDRVGIKPADRERHLKERVREMQDFARKIPAMFQKLNAENPNL